MKKELDDKLCSDYPNLFKNRYGDMRTTAMCWGFSCGDGWYSLIDDLCRKIMEIDPNGHVVADQVKEKFGGLRFYFHLEHAEDSGCEDLFDKVEDLVRETEDKSLTICEYCGGPGKQRYEGWMVYTLCDTCYESMLARRKQRHGE